MNQHLRLTKSCFTLIVFFTLFSCGKLPNTAQTKLDDGESPKTNQNISVVPLGNTKIEENDEPGKKDKPEGKGGPENDEEKEKGKDDKKKGPTDKREGPKDEEKGPKDKEKDEQKEPEIEKPENDEEKRPETEKTDKEKIENGKGKGKDGKEEEERERERRTAFINELMQHHAETIKENDIDLNNPMQYKLCEILSRNHTNEANAIDHANLDDDINKFFSQFDLAIDILPETADLTEFPTLTRVANKEWLKLSSYSVTTRERELATRECLFIVGEKIYLIEIPSCVGKPLECYILKYNEETNNYDQIKVKNFYKPFTRIA